MVDWLQLTSKVFNKLIKLGATSEKTLGKSSVNNVGNGTVNYQQNIIIYNQATDKTLDPKTLLEIQKMFAINGFDLKTVDLDKKNALLPKNDEFDSDLFDFVEKILPSQDFALWYAGLILRQHYKNGDKIKVSQIKTDMINTNPIRGKNIANLCSAGYLESDIIPTYNSLSGSQQMQDFIPYYEQLVTQTPTSIFINHKHTAETLKKEVLEKIDFAKMYSADSIRLFALSEKNVELGKNIISELEEKTKKEKIIFNVETLSRLEITILIN